MSFVSSVAHCRSLMPSGLKFIVFSDRTHHIYTLLKKKKFAFIQARMGRSGSWEKSRRAGQIRADPDQPETELRETQNRECQNRRSPEPKVTVRIPAYSTTPLSPWIMIYF